MSFHIFMNLSFLGTSGDRPASPGNPQLRCIASADGVSTVGPPLAGFFHHLIRFGFNAI